MKDKKNLAAFVYLNGTATNLKCTHFKQGWLKKGFFSSSTCVFLVWRKRQELQQNKFEKLQLCEHWVLEIFSY